MAHDALVASRMNVTDDGKQPRMRDTTFNGRHFSMVDPSTGKAKGLLRVEKHSNTDNLICVLISRKPFSANRGPLNMSGSTHVLIGLWGEKR